MKIFHVSFTIRHLISHLKIGQLQIKWRMEHGKWKIIAVIVLLLQLNTGIVFAQEITPSPSPKPVDYTLPYPGLLPDHPLYFLRALRDTLQEVFVSDPVKKAEYYQLQADKGISASQVLARKEGAVVLAAATAGEALTAYDKAIEAAMEAKKQGHAIQEIRNKLIESNCKHREVLEQIRDSVKESEQAAFKKEEQKARELGNKAKTLLPAK